jgi:hypothetical protein
MPRWALRFGQRRGPPCPLAIDPPHGRGNELGVLALTDPKRPPNRPARSSSPTGTSRAGRREADRRRHDEVSTLERLRTPILVLVVVAAVVGIGLFAFNSATSPAYACSSVDSVQVPAEGETGQVQPDMGRGHLDTGDKATYPVCPPASGKHLNKKGFGPLQPKVYGPDDQSAPTGWVHNLEHGGLVLLYSCTKGACDGASIETLKQFSAGFPASAICGIPAGDVGPVVAKFDDMPTRYAALVWDRAYYFDTLEAQKVYDYYLAYGEKVGSDGTWLAPPEAQCAAPTPAAPTPVPAPPAKTSPGPSAG